MESKKMNISDFLSLRREFVTSVCETLEVLPPENIDTISVSITITTPEKSEGYSVVTATRKYQDGYTTIRIRSEGSYDTSQDRIPEYHSYD